MRRLICLLLLVCLPLQSFAMQGGARLFVGVGGQSIQHEIDHAEGTRHHHDAGGKVHYDNSDESVQHIQDHSSPQPAFLIEPFQAIAPQQTGCAVGDMVARHIPHPFVDSLLRPPARGLA